MFPTEFNDHVSIISNLIFKAIYVAFCLQMTIINGKRAQIVANVISVLEV
jgi:hypothetical protein